MTDSPRLVAYIRVSRVGGRSGESFQTVSEQRRSIGHIVGLTPGAEVIEWIEDLDESGGTMDRPGVRRAMDMVDAGDADGVVCAYLDRWARTVEALERLERWSDEGKLFLTAAEKFDIGTSHGRFALGMMLLVAKYYRDRTVEMWDASTRNAIERGVHVKVPFGYQRANGKGSTLEPDPVQAPLVAAMFKMRAAGESWMTIARWLDATGVPPRHSEKWSLRAVQTIIGNRAYLGEARYGRHINAAAHQALVAASTFDAAHNARGRRPARGELAVLSGLVRCAGCGYRMHAATVGQRQQKVYRCKRRHGGGDCAAPAYMTRSDLDAIVIERFLAHYGDIALEGRVADTSLLEAQQRVAEAEAELEAFRSNERIRTTLAKLGGDHYENDLEARVQDVLDARTALERARQHAVGFDLGPATAVWPELSTEERRRLLTEGIDAVVLRRTSTPGGHVVDPARIKVFWRGEAPRDLPGSGIRVGLRPIDW